MSFDRGCGRHQAQRTLAACGRRGAAVLQPLAWVSQSFSVAGAADNAGAAHDAPTAALKESDGARACAERVSRREGVRRGRAAAAAGLWLRRRRALAEAVRGTRWRRRATAATLKGVGAGEDKGGGPHGRENGRLMVMSLVGDTVLMKRARMRGGEGGGGREEKVNVTLLISLDFVHLSN